MTEVLPRRYKARYAASMAGEIRKNVVLADGEEIIHSQRVRERKSWLIAQPRLLAVTDLQMILLEHNLLSPDWDCADSSVDYHKGFSGRKPNEQLGRIHLL